MVLDLFSCNSPRITYWKNLTGKISFKVLHERFWRFFTQNSTQCQPELVRYYRHNSPSSEEHLEERKASEEKVTRYPPSLSRAAMWKGLAFRVRALAVSNYQFFKKYGTTSTIFRLQCVFWYLEELNTTCSLFLFRCALLCNVITISFANLLISDNLVCYSLEISEC